MRVVEAPSLGEYAAAWDRLVAAMPLPSPFLRSWWLGAVDDGRGAYVLVLDGGRLVGGLPLTKRTLPGLTVYRFVGHGVLCPDHLDVVAATEQAAKVTEALADWARRPGNRLFDLAGVAEQSRIPSWLPGARTHELEAAPCEPLPGRPADYFDARARSFRKTVRRTRNRLDRIGARIHRADSAELGTALDAFERLHRERGDRAELLAEFPRLRRALGAGVPLDEAWVDVLESPDQVIAVSVSFVVGDRVSLYQTARAQDGVADNASTILDLAAIEEGIAVGCTEVDLLRGEEPYKRYFAGGVRRLFRVRGAHGLLGRGALAAIGAARTVRNAVWSIRAPRA